MAKATTTTAGGTVKTSTAPKGAAAKLPAPETQTHGSTSAINDPTTKPCACPDGDCRVNALDLDNHHCRLGNEPEDHRPPLNVDASDEMVEALARIVCQEEGHDPDQNYHSVKRWSVYIPEARAFIRMFNLLVNKALVDG